MSLIDEGVFDPPIPDIVDRSNVSERSIFRYFEHVDDLRHAVIGRIVERSAHLLVPAVTCDVELDKRISQLVRTRVRFCEAQRGVGWLATSREHYVRVIAEELAQFRGVLRAQIAELFAPELEHLQRRDREDVLGSIFILLSFESWDLHSRVLGWPAARIERSLTKAIRSLVIS